MGGCKSVLCWAALGDEELIMDTFMLVAFESGSVEPCEASDVYVFVEGLYLSAAG